MVAFRARRDVLIEDSRLSLNELLEHAQIEWHGVALHKPDWSDDSHSIALTVSSYRGSFTLHAALNAYWETLNFELPANRNQKKTCWRRWVDTSLPSPEDICSWEAAPIINETKYLVAPRSLVLLFKTD